MDKILDQAEVAETFTTGRDLARCAEKIEVAIAGEDHATAVASLLSLSVLLQAPNITEDQLQRTIWALSQLTCQILAGTDTPTGGVTH